MSSLWNGFETKKFIFNGREAILVFPKENANKSWALKTEYWDAFPEVEAELLKRGFHIAYLKNRSRFATVDDCKAKAELADFLSREYGLSSKCVPIGYSCGGAHAVVFAGLFPEKVQCMYIDAPVLNFCDYPGRLNDEHCEKVWEDEFVKAYPDITRAKLFDFKNHPINYIPVITENKIPVIMLYGNEDTVVDYSKNGKLMELEYKDNPLLTVVERTGQGHHPHGGEIHHRAKVIDFIINQGVKL